MGTTSYDAIVIGGGFFGCSVALHLKRFMDRVLILERNSGVLQRASFANQARVHNGYHYPRSFLTAVRSRVNFTRFVNEFADCIDRSFDSYYAIGKNFSNVTAGQFKALCERIGAPLKPAPKDVVRLFNMDLIEEVFWVEECTFDAVKLRQKIDQALSANEVEVRLESEVLRVSPTGNAMLEVSYANTDEACTVTSKSVITCTYSQTNQVLKASGVSTIPLKHELAEIALIEVPSHLRGIGITIMCGPFFSTLPFPPRKLHTLTHVRYTPHYSWQDTAESCFDCDKYLKIPLESNFTRMIKDAQRYIPSLRECRYVDSIWDVKTVLPSSEIDDSRPILFRKDHGFRNLACVMGAKIDNIYDVISELDELQLEGVLS